MRTAAVVCLLLTTSACASIPLAVVSDSAFASLAQPGPFHIAQYDLAIGVSGHSLGASGDLPARFRRHSWTSAMR
ncbi:MAG: hypothetical protein M3041_10885 [Acidobacteriota bacterium]|nr:hypothetical protein [Acidobacteriota bacterium]